VGEERGREGVLLDHDLVLNLFLFPLSTGLKKNKIKNKIKKKRGIRDDGGL
jgi:hypothetical protein